MATLLAVKTGSGNVTITETNVIVDIPGGRKSETITRATITRIDSNVIMPSLFGFGGGSNITLHTSDGRHVTLRFVKPKDAKALLAALR